MSVSSRQDAAAIAAANADDVDRRSRIPEEALSAMQADGLLGLLVPPECGGPGRRLSHVASMCHALAQSCGASGMIYAMHQIQVACIVAHAGKSAWPRELLRRIATDQLLLGSVTSEVGTGAIFTRAFALSKRTVVARGSRRTPPPFPMGRAPMRC